MDPHRVNTMLHTHCEGLLIDIFDSISLLSPGQHEILGNNVQHWLLSLLVRVWLSHRETFVCGKDSLSHTHRGETNSIYAITHMTTRCHDGNILFISLTMCASHSLTVILCMFWVLLGNNMCSPWQASVLVVPSDMAWSETSSSATNPRNALSGSSMLFATPSMINCVRDSQRVEWKREQKEEVIDWIRDSEQSVGQVCVFRDTYQIRQMVLQNNSSVSSSNWKKPTLFH